MSYCYIRQAGIWPETGKSYKIDTESGAQDFKVLLDVGEILTIKIDVNGPILLDIRGPEWKETVVLRSSLPAGKSIISVTPDSGVLLIRVHPNRETQGTLGGGLITIDITNSGQLHNC